LEFANTFNVQVPVDEAWAILTDVERIAPCMPGAELTEVIDENSFKGKVSVRLGPVALTFAGDARFEDRDDAGHSDGGFGGPAAGGAAVSRCVACRPASRENHDRQTFRSARSPADFRYGKFPANFLRKAVGDLHMTGNRFCRAGGGIAPQGV